MPVQRGRALLGIVFVGIAQIASLVLGAIVNAADLPFGGRVALLVTTIVINVAVFAAMFRYLTSAGVVWRQVWPGAVAAGLAATVLQQFGTTIVRQITANAGATYGQFALVLGLVTWLGFLAIATLMSCELNAALARRNARGQTPVVTS
jgi:uncharacterized BrkB/YihY/UPF0761 family membrane protein